MKLKKIFSEITERLDEVDSEREEVLKISRKMTRLCGEAIKLLHRKNFEKYEEKLTQIKEIHAKMRDLVKKKPGLYSKYLKTPEQEYIEATSLHAIFQGEELQGPEEYGVDEVNYVLGLADVIGELRRHALDNMRVGNLEGIEEILDTMDTLYTHLFGLDYPKGIVRDLRHKTDVARTLIEKTRGDVSLSVQMDRLREDLKDI